MFNRTDSDTYFIKNKLTKSHPAFEFKQGDLVSWVNDYGVEWEHEVLGFGVTDGCNSNNYKPQPCIHLDTDCYWFPYTVSRAKKNKFKLLDR